MRRLVPAPLAFALAAFPVLLHAQDADPLVARVDGTELRRSDLEAAAAELPEQYRQLPLEALYEPLQQRVIDNQLLAAEAERRDLAADPEVQKQLERLRALVLRDSLVQDRVAAASTPEALQERYAAEKDELTVEEVQTRHILLKSEAEAAEVIAQLDAGAEFEAVAKEKSTDPSAKQNGGMLGWISREQVVPEFGEAAFALEPGGRTAEPVQSQFGWHVIEVEDRRTTTPTFEEAEPQLRQEIGRETVTRLLEELRVDAAIERFGPDGQKLPDPDAAPAPAQGG